MVASVTRFLDPRAALAVAADGMEFTESRPLGTWVLDALRTRLGIGDVLRTLLKGRLDRPRSECCSRWWRTGHMRRPSS